MRKAMDIEGNRIDYDPKAGPAPDALLFAHGEYAPRPSSGPRRTAAPSTTSTP